MYEALFLGQTAYAETRTILSGLQTQFNGTCQYPLAKSCFATSLPPLRASKMFETDGIGYPSPDMIAFRPR